MRAGRRVSAAVATMFAACYSPSPPAGAPCANGACPDPLVCSPATNTCEHGLTGADGRVIDALLGDSATDGLVIDAQLIDAAPDAPRVDPFAALNTEQWKLPCTGPNGSNGLCPAGSATRDIQLVDTTTDLYLVTLRIRAVVEGGNYSGGSAVNGTEAYVGGAPANTFLTILELVVSSPPQHFYLNNGSGLPGIIDYDVPILIDSTAKVSMFISGQDGLQEPNANGSGSAIVIPGVITNPMPFNGEFAQLNVVSELKM